MSIALLNHASIGHKIKRDLVAYWPLAAAGAVHLLDHSANASTLTNNNTVTRAAGPSNNLPDAADFVTANSEFLSVADNPPISLGSAGDWSIAVWAEPDQVTTLAMVLGKDVSGGREFNLQMTAIPRWVLEVFDGTNLLRTITVTNVTPTQDTWAFLCAFWDSKNLVASLRVNAADRTFGTAAASAMGDTATQLEIGSRSFVGARNFWDGGIAHLGIWRRLLSPAEEAWLYNGGNGRDLTREA